MFCGLFAAYEVPRKGPLPLKVDSKGRYHSRSLRFNNNLIIDLSNLKYVVKELLAEPWRLGWLDLSFNKVIDIDSVSLFLFFMQIYHKSHKKMIAS